jgi:hypothetical protein
MDVSALPRRMGRADTLSTPTCVAAGGTPATTASWLPYTRPNILCGDRITLSVAEGWGFTVASRRHGG